MELHPSHDVGAGPQDEVRAAVVDHRVGEAAGIAAVLSELHLDAIGRMHHARALGARVHQHDDEVGDLRGAVDQRPCGGNVGQRGGPWVRREADHGDAHAPHGQQRDGARTPGVRTWTWSSAVIVSALPVLAEVQPVVVREVHEVEPRPLERRGVLRRRLEREA